MSWGIRKALVLSLFALAFCTLAIADSEPKPEVSEHLKGRAAEIDDVIAKFGLVRPPASALNDLMQCRLQSIFDPKYTIFSRVDFQELSKSKCNDKFCMGSVAPFDLTVAKATEQSQKYVDWLEKQKKDLLNLNGKDTIPVSLGWDDFATDDQELEDRWRKSLVRSIEAEAIRSGIPSSDVETLKKIQLGMINNLQTARQALMERWKKLDAATKSDLLVAARVSCKDTYARIEKLEDSGAASFPVTDGIFTVQFGEKQLIGQVVPGSSADKGNTLHQGDQVLEIRHGGKKYDFTDPQQVDAYYGLQFKEGDKIEIDYQRKGEKATTSITADTNMPYDGLVRSRDINFDGKKLRLISIPKFMHDEPGRKGIGTEPQVSRALRAPGEHDAIILDLRSNKGGIAIDSIHIASNLLDKEPTALLKTIYKDNGKTLALNESGGHSHPISDKPVFILVNRQSASASEILARALADRGRAVIIGERTYGKGIQQNPIGLKDGSAFFLTAGIRTSIDGKPLHKAGVEPHLYLPSASGTNPSVGEKLDVPVSEVEATEQPAKQTGNYWQVDKAVIEGMQKDLANIWKKKPELIEVDRVVRGLSALQKEPISLNFEKARTESETFAELQKAAERLGLTDSVQNFDTPGFATQYAWAMAVEYLKRSEQKASQK